MTISVVGFGGGHGLYATLRSLNFLKNSEFPELDITAIVGVSDDGGSSGRLRSEFPIVPPGDIRMALAALCPSTESDIEDDSVESIVQFRFDPESSSSLAGHVVGNIILTALWTQGLSTVEGISLFGRMLNIEGRVLPATETPTIISALVRDSSGPPDTTNTREVVGQVAVAKTSGQVQSTHLHPADVKACSQAIECIEKADVLVFGPGSWFTSVTPHLLITDLREAILRSDALKVLVMNLESQMDETSNYDPCDYLLSWTKFAPGISIDVVIADPDYVQASENLAALTDRHGATMIWRSLAASENAHDPKLLAEAFGIVLGMKRGATWQ